jgi:hypothetical protein
MSKTATDPIFAKIEAHRATVAAWNAAGDISGKMHSDDPGYEAAERLTSKESDREMKALRCRELLRCLIISGSRSCCVMRPTARFFLAGALRSLVGCPAPPAVDEAGSPR